ncbi:hypothetical protein [Natronoglycomyces albus]|uniref:Uncharacterized protein n=1 Tax=Natronoglycomyces albus TaxID=2811108 RepID=A0A895XTC8_9ACTN|nr:hypothetical protein [Natronoglycomyces albus]QSB05510.1 hypothetical protein JQS30_00775 [Natronoglycomyces albus]
MGTFVAIAFGLIVLLPLIGALRLVIGARRAGSGVKAHAINHMRDTLGRFRAADQGRRLRDAVPQRRRQHLKGRIRRELRRHR